MPTQPLGSVWRGRAWDDANPIPRVTLPDGTLAEAMASMGYAWNATSSVFQKITVDNATGGLNVTVVSGAVTATDAAARSLDGVTQNAVVDVDARRLLEQVLLELKFQTAMLAALAPSALPHDAQLLT